MNLKKIAIAGLLGAGLVFAQPGVRGPRGLQSDDLKKFLNLSDAQVQQIRDVAKQQVEGVKPIADQMRDKSNALRDEMQKDSPDQAKVGQLTVDLKNLREQLRSKRAARVDSLSAVLTPDQREKLKTLEEAAKLGPAVRQAAALGLIAPELSPERRQALGQAMRMRGERGPVMRSRGARLY
jgi:Spy/CpxP family protein refolding chaperone